MTTPPATPRTATHDDPEGQGMAFRAFGEQIAEIGLRQIERPLNDADVSAAAFLARGVLGWALPGWSIARCEHHDALVAALRALVGSIDGSSVYDVNKHWSDRNEALAQARRLLRDLSGEEEGQ